jgi:hypothetical protein
MFLTKGMNERNFYICVLVGETLMERKCNFTSFFHPYKQNVLFSTRQDVSQKP